MQLEVRDRIHLASVLPQKSTLSGIKTKRDILKKISLSNEEKTEIEYVEDHSQGVVKWNSEKQKPLNVTFTDEESSFLNETFNSLDQQSLITDELYDVFTKIKEGN